MEIPSWSGLGRLELPRRLGGRPLEQRQRHLRLVRDALGRGAPRIPDLDGALVAASPGRRLERVEVSRRLGLPHEPELGARRRLWRARPEHGTGSRPERDLDRNGFAVSTRSGCCFPGLRLPRRVQQRRQHSCEPSCGCRNGPRPERLLPLGGRVSPISGRRGGRNELSRDVGRGPGFRRLRLCREGHARRSRARHASDRRCALFAGHGLSGGRLEWSHVPGRLAARL